MVGFIEAEGYFFTFQPTKEKYLTLTFSRKINESLFSSENKPRAATSRGAIVQSRNKLIIEAIKECLSLSSNPYHNITTNSYSINTTSTRGIKNIITFLKNAPVKLKGYKLAQYLKWLHSLRVNPKYTNFNIPFKYV